MSDNFQSCLDVLTEKQASGQKQLKEELIDMRSTLKQAMDKGLTPADMETALAVTEAVQAADEAVDKIYKKLFD